MGLKAKSGDSGQLKDAGLVRFLRGGTIKNCAAVKNREGSWKRTQRVRIEPPGTREERQSLPPVRGCVRLWRRGQHRGDAEEAAGRVRPVCPP